MLRELWFLAFICSLVYLYDFQDQSKNTFENDLENDCENVAQCFQDFEDMMIDEDGYCGMCTI